MFKNNKKLLISAAMVFIASLLLSITLLTRPGPVSHFRFNEDAMTGPGLVNLLNEYKNKLPKPYIVQSGSMEPAIKTGSLVFSTPSDSYQQGDIITFHPKGRSQDTVTHRIVFKLYPAGINTEPTYITAGDANEDLDSSRVTNEQIIGKVGLSVPYLGYLADYAKTPQGFILLVIVPATIIIYEELRSLKREIFKRLSKYFNRLNQHFLNKSTKKEIAINERGLPKTAILLPIFGAFFVMTALSASYFLDKEFLENNVLSVSTSYGEPTGTTPTPTPSPTPTQEQVVINEFVADPDTQFDGEWLEIFNGTSSTVDLTGWTLVDLANNSRDLSSFGSIAPGGFAVYEEGQDGWLNNSGDTITLFDDSENEIDSHSYSDSETDESIGRENDGGEPWKDCNAPTKGSSNNGSC